MSTYVEDEEQNKIKKIKQPMLNRKKIQLLVPTFQLLEVKISQIKL